MIFCEAMGLGYQVSHRPKITANVMITVCVVPPHIQTDLRFSVDVDLLDPDLGLDPKAAASPSQLARHAW